MSVRDWRDDRADDAACDKCKASPCACVIRSHAIGCPYRQALLGGGADCTEHGAEACFECHRCTCGGALR